MTKPHPHALPRLSPFRRRRPRRLAPPPSLAAQPTPAPAATAATPAFDPKLAIPATNDGLPGAGPIRRYDWFTRLWQERRNQWAARVQQDQRAVVFLGDSITQGWHDDLDGSFPELKVANRGISGDTTRGVLIRLQEDVLALHPRAVVLLIGTNDLEEAGGNPWVVASQHPPHRRPTAHRQPGHARHPLPGDAQFAAKEPPRPISSAASTSSSSSSPPISRR